MDEVWARGKVNEVWGSIQAVLEAVAAAAKEALWGPLESLMDLPRLRIGILQVFVEANHHGSGW